MADVNITGSGTFAANSYTVPNPVAGQSKVSFHSANAGATVCFDNYATFNAWSLPLTQGNKQDLTVQAVQNTGFSVNAANFNCPQSRSPNAGGGYNITMGGGKREPKEKR